MSRTPKAAACRSLRALLGDQQGMAVVEFAFMATFMIFIYLGSQQLADAIFANRKVTTATRTVADLTTQYSVVTNDDLDMILGAAAKVLSPYDAAHAKIRVTLITVDNNNNAKVTWSKGLHVAGRTANQSFTLPTEISVPNTSLVYGEVEYEHRPLVQGYSVGTITMSDQIFMSPRVSNSVNLT